MNNQHRTTENKMVTNGITGFGIKLLQTGVNTVQNGIVAAYSVASVLGMALLGAGGNTASEIKTTLNPSTSGLSSGPNSRSNSMDWDDEDEIDGSQPSTHMDNNEVTDITSEESHHQDDAPVKHHRTNPIKKVKLMMQRTSSKEKFPFIVVDEEFHKALAATIRNEDNKGETNGNTKPGYILRNANKFYIRKGGSVSKAYISNAKRLYETEPEVLNFAHNPEKCRHEINHWVEKQTEAKIQDLVPQGSIDGNTSIVIVNAIYFKGKWENEFDPERTSQRIFTSPNGEQVKTDFMHNNDIFSHKIDAARECQVLELPYVNGDLSFFVILPDQSKDFAKFQQSLDSEVLSDLTNNLRKREIVVYLPKFKIQVALDLSDVLQALGIKELFVPGKANLTHIDPKGTLYVSGVIHKAFIEVNEFGSEAAAATAEFVRAAGLPRKRTIFNADHPFIFLIKDNRTNAILFLGQFCQPEVSIN